MSVELRMVQQMSGARGGGVDWPPPGGTLTVSEAEAELLTHTDSQHPVPIAVRVEQPKTEVSAPPPAAVETRPGPAEDEPVKRGPGRPPGSTNKPK